MTDGTVMHGISHSIETWPDLCLMIGKDYSGTAMYAEPALIKRSMAVVINLSAFLWRRSTLLHLLYSSLHLLQFCCTTTLQKQMLLI